MSSNQPTLRTPWPASQVPQPSHTATMPEVDRFTWGFPEFFIIGQILAPAILFLPGTQPLRVLIRTAPFMVSVAALIWYGRKSFHTRPDAPAQKWLLLCSLCLVAMIFHPTTNSILAGMAHCHSLSLRSRSHFLGAAVKNLRRTNSAVVVHHSASVAV